MVREGVICSRLPLLPLRGWGYTRFLRPTYATVSKGSCSGTSFALEPRCCLGGGIGELFVGDLPKVFRQVMVVIGYVGVIFGGMAFLEAHLSIMTGSQLFADWQAERVCHSQRADEDSGRLCTLRTVDADTTDRGSGRENVE
jgi:hypothetical protein